MPVSSKKKRPAQPVIDFDKALQFPALAVPSKDWKPKPKKRPGDKKKGAKA